MIFIFFLFQMGDTPVLILFFPWLTLSCQVVKINIFRTKPWKRKINNTRSIHNLRLRFPTLKLFFENSDLLPWPQRVPPPPFPWLTLICQVMKLVKHNLRLRFPTLKLCFNTEKNKDFTPHSENRTGWVEPDFNELGWFSSFAMFVSCLFLELFGKIYKD